MIAEIANLLGAVRGQEANHDILFTVETVRRLHVYLRELRTFKVAEPQKEKKTNWEDPFKKYNENWEGFYRGYQGSNSDTNSNFNYEDFVRDFMGHRGAGFKDWQEARSSYEKEQGEKIFDEEAKPQKWWQVLGLRPESTKSQITKAYRRLAQKYHPDKKPHGDTEMFKKINAAYKEGLEGARA